MQTNDSANPVANGDFSPGNVQDTEELPRNGNVVRSTSRDRRRGRKPQTRLVYKNGEYNLSYSNIKKRRQRYLADIFTTMLDLKWRWNLFLFVMAFILSWLIFALIWWLICFSHGDFENFGEPDWKPCLEEVYDFTTALLYSIETQHTIGYGSRATSPHCPEAILVMMIQSCIGVIIQALMTGVVFAKLSRSKKRAMTLMFSKNALISKRDGKLCLLIRLGDMRKSNLIDAHCRGILLKKRVSEEGEVMPLYQHELNFGLEDQDSRLFLVWPIIIEHTITENSPLWELSPESLRRDRFELVVVLEGTVESTGTTAQARTSYLPQEILWGRRFEKLVTFQKENGQYRIDYSLFHSSVEFNIPDCSAKELEEMEKKMKEEEKYDETTTTDNDQGTPLKRSISDAFIEGSNTKLNLMSFRSMSTQTLKSDMATTTEEDFEELRDEKSSDKEKGLEATFF